ncbi:hypothetical protein FA95DRAFT_1505120 [Auriscalpium vulgare]|uniref:Uncharacterized protein n=1 Tax=Auriscalpium vulgare TaxID=40419 RepID=A0ACB8R3R3_9AGAM|nr:hypothetical protein FA95DRAFT_1505120 [Auriscalpium vulgare]
MRIRDGVQTEGEAPDQGSPIYRINANRAERWYLLKVGVLEDASEEVWCAAGYTHSQRIAEEVNRSKRNHTFEELVPEQYRDFASVFSEQESERLPEHKPWDHVYFSDARVTRSEQGQRMATRCAWIT